MLLLQSDTKDKSKYNVLDTTPVETGRKEGAVWPKQSLLKFLGEGVLGLILGGVSLPLRTFCFFLKVYCTSYFCFCFVCLVLA
jgi:hypothetical protein